MPNDRILRWNVRAVLALTVGLFVVAACGPMAPDPTPDDVMEINITALGPGTVRQPSSGFVCRGDCAWTGTAEEATGFVAAADGANAFVAWTGTCHTLDATCANLLEDGDAITATFAPHALRLHLTGDGEGEFRIQGPAIDLGCTEDCAVGLAQALDPGLAITYFAHGSTETVLDDWGGACAGAGSPAYCVVPVNGATDVSKTWRRPPVAVDDAYTTTRNAPLSVRAGEGVLANDSDTPGDSLTAERVADATHGTLALAADGGFSYTPDPGFAGTDTFTYRVRDAFGNLSRTATVTITVTRANRPPVTVDDAYDADANTTLVVPAPGILTNDTDPDDDLLTATLDTNVTNGTLTLNTNGSFTYTPDDDFSGIDTFTYTANDGQLTSEPATVTITVTRANRPPVANDDSYQTAWRTTLVVPAPGILTNDTDPDDDPLTATLDTNVTNGTLTLNTNGSFTYTPNDRFTGEDTFTYTANDSELTSAPATVTITVTRANRPPVTVDDTYDVEYETRRFVRAPGILTNDSDPDGDDLTATLIDDAANGKLKLAANGSFTYTPDDDFSGIDTFTYTANDGELTSAPATVTLTVEDDDDDDDDDDDEE